MAECKRLDPEHVGPNCGCADDACILNVPDRRVVPAPSSEQPDCHRCLGRGVLAMKGETFRCPDCAGRDGTEQPDIDRLADTHRSRTTFRDRIKAVRPRYRELNSPLWDVLDEAEAAEARVAELEDEIVRQAADFRLRLDREVVAAVALAGRVAELERKLLAEGLTVQEQKIKAEATLGRVAELEAALRWYAEQRNYRYAGGDDRNAEHNENYCRVMQDDAWLGGQPGSRARAALAGDGGGS